MFPLVLGGLTRGTEARSSRAEMFCKKALLKNFTKLTGNHLCQGLFIDKVAGLRLVALLKNNSDTEAIYCLKYEKIKDYLTP